MYLLRAFCRIAIPLLPLALFFVPIASVRAAEPPCPNETLRAENNSSELPDCRGYEQVSPAEKDSGSGGVFFFDSLSQAGGSAGALPMQSLADGSVITYPGEPVFEVESTTREKVEREGIFREQYTSERLSSGWKTHVGDTLGSETTPTPVLPSAAETGANFANKEELVEETSNGSKVFFLDAADTAQGEPDLYEYDVNSKQLVDLTVDKNAGENADVRGILGVGGEGDKEGSYVYFVAAGSLAPGATLGECKPSGGANKTEGTGCKLYLSHGGVTTYITTLSALDEQGGTNDAGFVNDWSGASGRTAQVSPNGRHLAFTSNLPLTGQATTGPQMFRFNAAPTAAEPSLVCVSCSPTGASVAGAALNPPSTSAEVNGAARQRYMLNNGRVIFDTASALVSGDVNKETDVYEWEPAGTGSCTEGTATASSAFAPSEDACVSLISGGTATGGPALLADASDDASNIFFTTGQSLVPGDGDEIADMYDAREGGGFLPPPPAACPGEVDCRVGTPPGQSGPGATSSAPAAEPPPAHLNLDPTPAITKPLTRAQKLAKALRACQKDRSKKARTSCQKKARRTYGPKKKAKRPATNGGAN